MDEQPKEVKAFRITPKGVVYAELLRIMPNPGDLPERIMESLGIRAQEIAGMGNVAGIVWRNGSWQWAAMTPA